MLKKTVISNTQNPIIVADSSKFNQISNIKFADIQDASIITDTLPKSIDRSVYRKLTVLGSGN